MRVLARSDAQISLDAPLQEGGLESSDLPAFIDELNATLDVHMPTTLVFECGTLRGIVSRLNTLALPETPLLHIGSEQPSVRAEQAAGGPPLSRVLVHSRIGRWPGGPTATRLLGSQSLYPLRAAGGDAIKTIPARRWEPAAAEPRPTNFGGFVACADRFDPASFGVSSAEAHTMSPQQRLLLETCYSVTHVAGTRRTDLLGQDVGVFVGIMNTDFAIVTAGSESVYTATGSQLSIASGRLSFALGTQGPCASIATACASALVALDLSLLNLRAGTCSSLLVAAANLILVPVVSLRFARAGMLSKDGRCKTFDSRANGYVRSEGVGALALTLTSVDQRGEAFGSAAIGKLYCVGCAVRSDGKSVSLTAPNGSAQARLVEAAMAAAASSRLRLVATHGTGTALGDPTEAGGLERALGGKVPVGGPLLSSAKASVGHCEPAAGFRGLVSLASMLEQRASAVNAKLRILNRLLHDPFDGLGAHTPTQSEFVHDDQRAAVGGVSSFAYSGTISHAVLCAPPSLPRLPSARIAHEYRYRRSVFRWQPRKPKADHGASAPLSPRHPAAAALRQPGLHGGRGSRAGPREAHIPSANLRTEHHTFEGASGARTSGASGVATTVSSLDGQLNVGDLHLRIDASRSAEHALDSLLPGLERPCPARSDVVIVGAGLAGLLVASEFEMVRADSALFEMTANVGGVWRQYANPFSRVNSSEPAYRLPVDREHGHNTNHSHHSEILHDVRRMLEQYALTERLYLGVRVGRVGRRDREATSVAKAGEAEATTTITKGAWEVRGTQQKRVAEMGVARTIAPTTAHVEVCTRCDMAVLCVNRRLGVPRELLIPGEATFRGASYRGLFGDTQNLDYEGKRVIVVGMGAFALENLRTSFERGACHVVILARRRGVVSPQVIDYINFVRPWDDAFAHPRQGSAMVLDLWRSVYAKSGADLPECWQESPRQLKPDGHTVSVSDAFFVGHYLGLCYTQLGSAVACEPEGVRTDGADPKRTDTLLRADVIVKCVGFEYNESNEAILNRSRMNGLGQVDVGLWTMFEPHLDAGFFSMPFGSSIVNYFNFRKRVLVRYWRHPELSLPLLTSMQVQINTLTSAELWAALQEVMRADPEVKVMLREHLEQVAADFHSRFTPYEYVERNQILWRTIHDLLMPRAAPERRRWLDYGFDGLLDVLRLEGVDPHLGTGSGDSAAERSPTIAFLPSAAHATAAEIILSLEDVLEIVGTVAQAGIDADAPLMDAGLDSLGATELRSSLQAAVGEACELPATLVFEAPTARQIAASLVMSAGSPPEPPAVKCILSLEDVLEIVGTVAQAGIDADAPLMDAGLDSLGATELRSSLQAAVGEACELPATLVFEAPTARQIAVALVRKAPIVTDEYEEDASVPSSSWQNHSHQQAARTFPPGYTATVVVDARLQRMESTLAAMASALGVEPPLPSQQARDRAPQPERPVATVSRGKGPTDAAAMLAACALRLPSGTHDMDLAWRVVASAADVVGFVPATRWVGSDPLLANATLNAEQRASLCYGGFVKHLERFDSRRFGISAAEAAATDPQQRMLLELGYAALHGAAWSRARLLGTAASVFLGLEYFDFQSVVADSATLRASVHAVGNSGAMAAGRLSFVLGLHGPCMLVGTTCSSSLVAANAARECALGSSDVAGVPSLVAAASAMLRPTAHLWHARTGGLSRTGRCRTFDARADGFARSEGIVAAVLHGDSSGATRAGGMVWVGQAVCSDGRSASFTAPSGVAQQQMLNAALAAAGVARDAVDRYEAHGTGTALGDPTEMGAVTQTLLRQRNAHAPALAISGVKANIAHVEPGAGLVGLLLLARSLSTRRDSPNGQLKVMNPHVRAALRGCSTSPQHLCPQHVGSLARETLPTVTGGVSALGINGTIAHAIIQSSCVHAAASNRRQQQRWHLAYSIMPLRRRTFAWRELSHPFLELPIDGASHVTFKTPLSAQLHSVVADHVVHGRVIFPGAGYVEMARGGCCAIRAQQGGKGEGDAASLRGILFLRPFALHDPHEGSRCLECSIQLTSGNYEILSGDGAAMVPLSSEDAILHSTGTVASDAISPKLGSAHTVPAAARAGVWEAVEAAALYADFYLQSGLQYGPVHRTLAKLWTREDGAVWSAKLHRRASSERWGTGLHPADLDAAMQLPVAIWRRTGQVETVLPFAIDSARVHSAAGEMHAQAAASDPAGGGGVYTLQLESPELGLPAARYNRFKTRTFKQEAAVEAGSVPPLQYYAVEWQRHRGLNERGRLEGVQATTVLLLSCSVTPPALPGKEWSDGSQLVKASVTTAVLVVACHARGISGQEPLQAQLDALTYTQVLARATVSCPPASLVLISPELRAEVSEREVASPMHTGNWGLARTARQEMVGLPIRCAAVREASLVMALPCLVYGLPSATSASAPSIPFEPELEITVERCTAAMPHMHLCVPRLAELDPQSRQSSVPAVTHAVGPRGDHILLGGTGGLGMLTARWLAQRGASRLLLASRQGTLGRGADEDWRQLMGQSADVSGAIVRCCAGEQTDMQRLLSQSVESHIWHAAGLLADGTLPTQSHGSLRKAMAPKATAAWQLQRLCSGCRPLRGCTLFSSVSTLLGSAGQTNYAAANGCLDAIACHRGGRAEAALSVQWGPWAEVGLAVGKFTKSKAEAAGYRLIQPSAGLEALSTILSIASPSVLSVASMLWRQFPNPGPLAEGLLPRVTSSSSGGKKIQAVFAAAGVVVTLAAVLEAVQRTAGEEVDADVPLMDAGVDSLGAVELRNQLQSNVGEAVSLPSTLVFDHPTARSIAALVTRPVHGVAKELCAPKRAHASGGVGRGLAEATPLHVVVEIVCHSLLLPVGVVAGVAENASLHSASSCGRDLIEEVSVSRWDVTAALATLNSAAPEVSRRARHGGFLQGATLFDARRFGVSAAEALAMDPQQRLLLERGYAALHGGGLVRSNLLDSTTAVHVGQWESEFTSVLWSGPLGHSVYASTGATCSVTCGRVSFVLGLQGACASHNTACSSTLVASHCGLRALQGDECSAALVAGVNMLLDPQAMRSNATAGFTSVAGRSHTFDARADGYSRGEAINTTTCAPAKLEGPAACELLGSSIRQDGRSASLTAPNGQAQQRLLSVSLDDAGIDAAELGHLEAHGTGTALGDPIEAGAVAAILLEPPRQSPLLAGSLKANAGHTEPAAGLSGAIELILQLMQGKAAPNAQLRALNLMVESALKRAEEMCVLPIQLAGHEQRISDNVARGGMSSFGYSGTIGHAELACSGIRVVHSGVAASSLGFRRHHYRWRPEDGTGERKGPGGAMLGTYGLYACRWKSVPMVSPLCSTHGHGREWLVLTPASRAIFDSDSGGRAFESLSAAVATATGNHQPARQHRLGSTWVERPFDAASLKRLTRGASGDVVLLATEQASSAGPDMQLARSLLQVARLGTALHFHPSLIFLTIGAQPHLTDEQPPALTGAAAGACWGFSRVVRLECPLAKVHDVDLHLAAGASTLSRTPLLHRVTNVELFAPPSAGHDFQLSLSVTDGTFGGSNEGRHVPRLEVASSLPLRVVRAPPHDSPFDALVTGGLGGLGLRAASLMLACGASRLVLTSRTGRMSKGDSLPLYARQVEAGTAVSRVRTLACDMSSRMEAQHALPVGGGGGDEGGGESSGLAASALALLHTSGILRDKLLRNLQPSDVAAVFAPKATGAWHLHSASATCVLHASLAFSSTEATFYVSANFGQASYVAANAYMDTLARAVRLRAVPSRSLQIPPIAEAGMSAATLQAGHSSLANVRLCSLDQLAAALSHLVLSTAGASQQVWALLPWSRLPSQPSQAFMARLAPSHFYGMEPAAAAAHTPALPTVATPTPTAKAHLMSTSELRNLATTVASEVTGTATLGLDAPLMDAGLDSLAATELANRLRTAVRVAVSPTVAFDHPTARAVATHLFALLGEQSMGAERKPPVAVAAHALPDRSQTHPTIGLLVGTWAAGVAASSTRHELLCSAADAMRHVPSRRWTADSPADRVTSGWIPHVERFDAMAFGLSPLEAGLMDPQQRTLLEHGYAALHAQGLRRASLAEQALGVLVGIEHVDWMLLRAMQLQKTALQTGSMYAATGEQPHVASGRLAYSLDVRGPCLSVNTACSSGLVAMHVAATTLSTTSGPGECAGMLVAAAKLILIAYAAQPRFLAADGRSKSFDARADGYGRSEAVVATLLQDSEQGELLPVPSSSPSMLLGGVALQANGRSASLTAPNGSSLGKCMRNALTAAATMPCELDGLQAQGLGSALADPIEVNAAIDELKGSDAFLAVGCHKANVGHSEAPSGLAGVLTAQHSLLGSSSSPNANLRVLNVLIGESVRAHCCLFLPLDMARQRSFRSGVTAFGISGISVHCILAGMAATTPLSPALLPPILRADGPLAYRRTAFLWREPSHPFLSDCVASAGDRVLYRSPLGPLGELHAVVADHVVHGRVVFPAAAFLEMLHAVVGRNTASSDMPARAQLTSVQFVSMMSLESADAKNGQPSEKGRESDWVECSVSLRSGRMEVRSGQAPANYRTCCLATWQGAPAAAPAVAAVPSPACARLGCPTSRDASSELYDAQQRTNGVSLGPSFRQLDQTWAANGLAGRLRFSAPSRLMHHHPGSLDAMFASRILLPGGVDPEGSVLPVSVGHVHLVGSRDRTMWMALQPETSGALLSDAALLSPHVAAAGQALAHLKAIRHVAVRVERILARPSVAEEAASSDSSSSATVLQCQQGLSGSDSGRCELSLTTVLERTAKLIGKPADADAPLIEAGLDSLGAVELGNQLQGLLGDGVLLPSTLVFEHPTARLLEASLKQYAHGSSECAWIAHSPTEERWALNGAPSRLAVQLAGASSQLPRGVHGLEALWSMAASARTDPISEVPTSRWSLADADGSIGRARYGGFVHCAERFDNGAFGVSPAEALAMDPQQRLLLERGYAALHGARHEKRSLMGSGTGIFVGIAGMDFVSVLSRASLQQTSAYTATASAFSVACGRLSYVLGLHGPCVAIDTACSAALAAWHAGRRALQLRECQLEVTSAVNLMLTPFLGASFAVAGMTSSLGRCHAFDTRADGFVRAEACNGAVLRTSNAGLTDGTAEGQFAALSANGSAVRQDGRSASLTAPSGPAQQALIMASMEDADMIPDEFSSVEAHGTGTALGDPIEARSLSAVVLSPRDRHSGAFRTDLAAATASPLALAGVKASSGHAEPAAGLVGALKLVQQLVHCKTAPNALLRVLNSHVGSALHSLPCVLPAQLSGGARATATAAVSSLGYGGTIANAVLRASVPCLTFLPPACRRPPLSFAGKPFPWPRFEAATPTAAAQPSHPSHVAFTPPPTQTIYATAWRPCDDNSSETTEAELAPIKDLIVIIGSHGAAVQQCTLAAPQASMPGTPLMIAMAIGCGGAPSSYLSAICMLASILALAQAQAGAASVKRATLFLLTAPSHPAHAGAHPITGPQAGAWGLARTVRVESRLSCHCVEAELAFLTHAYPTSSSLAEPEVALRSGVRDVPRLKAVGTAAIGSPQGPVGSLGGVVHIVTGGTNGVGLLTARWLLQHGATGLLLASRGGKLAPTPDGSALSSIESADIARCDAAYVADVRALMSKKLGDGKLGGVWHAAGVLVDSLLSSQSAATLARACAAKAHGASALHAAVNATESLSAFILFSSVAGLLGNVGQANYGAASASLDGISGARRTCGVAATAVQFGAWAEVGMAARAGAASKRMAAMEAVSGLGRLTSEQGLSGLCVAMKPSWMAVLAVVPISWSRMRTTATASNAPLLSAFLGAEGLGTSAPVAAPSRTAVLSIASVLEAARQTSGGAVDADVPLMEAGVDSLGAVELRNQLQSNVGEAVSLPSTLMFEHPTAREIAAFLSVSLVDTPPPRELTVGSLDQRMRLLVLHASRCGRWPGAFCPSSSAPALAASADAVGAVPPTRWVEAEALSLSRGKEAADIVCARHGGFVQCAERFDNGAFGVSPAEALAMDPQQRLLLEQGYAALHGARHDKRSLMGSGTGIFVGIERPDWAIMQALAACSPSSSRAASSAYAATGDTASIAAGRLSYVLGLHGPCVAIDTACSSSLVALQSGADAIRTGSCPRAVASGVSLKLAPLITVTMSGAGMLSKDGRCKTFDSRANGYVRSEGVGSVVTAPEEVVAAAAVVLSSVNGLDGSAVRQDGRSASLTAPNGSAQRELIRAVSGNGGRGVGWLEAHGTGTALGDPTEAGSVAAVNSARDVLLVGGAAKANAGHAEPAAGMLGVAKAMLLLETATASGNAQLRTLNSHLRATTAAMALNTQRLALRCHEAGEGAQGSGGAVNAFGYAGTIAHAAFSKWTVMSLGLGYLARRIPLLQLQSRRRSFPWTPIGREHQPHAGWVEGVSASPAALLKASLAIEQDLRWATAMAMAASSGPPCEADVLIVGAGLAGLAIAAALTEAGCASLCIIERTSAVGGVWWHHANATSKVNSSEPSYRLGTLQNANHSPRHEILADVLRTVQHYDLASRLHLQMAVHTVGRAAAAGTAAPRSEVTSGPRKWLWAVCSARGCSRFTTQASTVSVCTNRRLGAPRVLPLRGEEVFEGAVRRGLAGDLASVSCNARQLVVVGMGAFAVEAMRTALQRGAAHVTFLCRQRGTVCPQLVDWLNFIRPRDVSLKHPTEGDAAVLSAWQSSYDTARAHRPDCWSKGQLKPDGHTVSVSDLFFIAHRHDAAATVVGEVARFEAHGVRSTSDESVLPASIAILCVGFEYNARIEALVGRSRMSGVGNVTDGLWVAVEAHLDGSTFHSPFGSSFLSVAKFTAKLVARAWRAPSAALAALPAAARISSYAVQHLLTSLDQLRAADAELAALLREHVDEVASSFNAACGLVEYVEANAVMWRGLQTLPATTRPNEQWAYPFGALAAEMAAEMEMPVTAVRQLEVAGGGGAGGGGMATASAAAIDGKAHGLITAAKPGSATTGGGASPMNLTKADLTTIVHSTVSELGASTTELDVPLAEGGLDSFAMFELAGALLSRTGVRLLGEATDRELTLRGLLEQVELRAAALASSQVRGCEAMATAEHPTAASSSDAAKQEVEAASRAYREAALGTSVARGEYKWQDGSAPSLTSIVGFVLCSPRSGSSLLQLMLNAHPQLYAPQELYLLPFHTMGERARHFERLAMPWMADGLLAALMELSGDSLEACREQVKSWGAEHETWRVYEHLQRLCAPRTLVDKTPLNAEHPAFFERALAIWEAPRFIHLYRHPLAVLDSHLKMARKMQLMATGTTSSDAEQWKGAEETWAATNESGLQLSSVIEAQARAAQQLVGSSSSGAVAADGARGGGGGGAGGSSREVVCSMRYEDLVKQPEQATRALCDLFGLGWAAEMASPYTSDAALRSFQTAEKGGIIVGDPKLLGRGGVDPKQADSWVYVMPPVHLEIRHRALATRLGYELPDVRFVQRGDDAHTPLVCIHGFDGRAAAFHLLGKALPASTPMLTLEHRFLASAHDPTYLRPATLDDLGCQLAERVLCVLGAGRPFHLVGYSTGALLAHRVHAAAKAAGGQPRRLALIDPPPPPEDWICDDVRVPTGRGAVLDGQLVKVFEMLKLATNADQRCPQTIGAPLGGACAAEPPPAPPALVGLADGMALAAALAYLNALPSDAWPAEQTSSFLTTHEVAMHIQSAMRSQRGVALGSVAAPGMPADASTAAPTAPAATSARRGSWWPSRAQSIRASSPAGARTREAGRDSVSGGPLASAAHGGALLVVASCRRLQFEVDDVEESSDSRATGGGPARAPVCSVLAGRDSLERLQACYGPVVETVELGGESSEHYACCTRCASGREPAFVAALAKLMKEE